MALSLEYVAGFADADGSIGITRTKATGNMRQPTYWARLTMYSQNLEVLMAINETFGGSGRIFDARLPEGAIGPGCYRVEWMALKAVAVLKQIEPFMVIKKAQAQLAIKMHETKRMAGSNAQIRWHGLPEEVRAFRAYAFDRMKELNHEDSETYRKNRVNSVDTLKRAIPSQATEGNGSVDGVTTSRVSPNNNPGQERPSVKTDVRDSLNHTILN